MANGFLALMELNGFSGLINIPILDIKNRHLQLINHSHFEAAFKNIYIYIYILAYKIANAWKKKIQEKVKKIRGMQGKKTFWIFFTSIEM